MEMVPDDVRDRLRVFRKPGSGLALNTLSLEDLREGEEDEMGDPLLLGEHRVGELLACIDDDASSDDDKTSLSSLAARRVLFRGV